MKKGLRLLSLVFTICCMFPVSVFAADDSFATKQGYEQPVGVTIETVNEDFASQYDFSNVSLLSGTVDLSKGTSTFTVGTLNANATYKTNTYSITKNTIKIGLQSILGASEHIKVTLYKSNGVSVAVATLSLPSSSPISGIAKYVSFTNLDPTYDYYAVIRNTDTTQSGSILGVAKQQ